MPALRFTRLAEADLTGIAIYTVQKWGEARAAQYIDRLEACCRNLARNPALGRACEEIRPGLRRMESGSHVVFYRRQIRGILVSRILHKSMLPELHEFENPQEDAE